VAYLQYKDNEEEFDNIMRDEQAWINHSLKPYRYFLTTKPLIDNKKANAELNSTVYEL